MKTHLEQALSQTPCGPLWKKIGVRSHNGIALPLSAVHSAHSCGIGEFLDLLPLIDFCHQLRLDVIQLLPLNDSGNDPSPYNALSSCALNPIYLSLHALPGLDAHLLELLEPLRAFTRSTHIPFPEVQSHKMHFLHTYFEKEGPALINSAAFNAFIDENPWVKPYALFKALKDRLEQNPWTTWPEELKTYSEPLFQTHFKEAAFYIALQHFCFLQLEQVRNYAHLQRLFLKGDIPILLSPDSADVWHRRELFDLTLSAGAPPDAYAKEGQYWGFPLWNWEALKNDNYNFWRQRLQVAARCYDLYRLDHVVGFFRIWGIPIGHPSSEGKFVPQDEKRWIPEGTERLKMLIAASPMLPIAEDLGTVPEEARSTLRELGVCGTKVIRWERLWNENGAFIPYRFYTPVSMTCVSTHDSPTLALWWRDFPEESKAFAAFKQWSYAPELTFAQRKELLTDAHHTPSLFHINLFQEYLALYPELVSPQLEEERINTPGKVLPTNWTYRFRPSIEEILSHPGLFTAMKEMIGR